MLRSPTPILDVPQSLTVLEQIAARGFNSVGDIIDCPGVSHAGRGTRDAVVFRGVRSTADFFIDGMRDDVQYYRPLYNLECEVREDLTRCFLGGWHCGTESRDKKAS